MHASSWWFALVVIWDIRPFAPQQRMLKICVGVQHNFEKVNKSSNLKGQRGASQCVAVIQNLLRCAWSPNGQRIAAGSADR